MEAVVAVAYILAMGVGVVALLALSGWLYQKSRRRLEHPDLGQIYLSAGIWNGRKPFRDRQVRVGLPGDREGPFQEGMDLFQKLWNELEDVLERVRPAALEDFEENKTNCDEEEFRRVANAVEAAVLEDSRGLDRYWSLTEVLLEEGEEDGLGYWRLEFDVAWDEEHSRSAYLDWREHQLLAYDLSCAVVLPYGTDS